jgi:hypothetical protein
LGAARLSIIKSVSFFCFVLFCLEDAKKGGERGEQQGKEKKIKEG